MWSYLTIIQSNLSLKKHLVMQAVPCHPSSRAVKTLGGKIEGEITTAHRARGAQILSEPKGFLRYHVNEKGKTISNAHPHKKTQQ